MLRGAQTHTHAHTQTLDSLAFAQTVTGHVDTIRGREMIMNHPENVIQVKKEETTRINRDLLVFLVKARLRRPLG